MGHTSPGLIAGAAVAFLVVATIAACSKGDAAPTPDRIEVPENIRLSSTAFTDGSDIPQKYTCDGADVSPPLAWSNVPQGTGSLVLIVDDPDARGWTHWTLYSIPAYVRQLPEAVSHLEGEGDLVEARSGVNDFKRPGYGGPCPPRGTPHRYPFTIYALDAELALDTGAKKDELLRAMEGLILAVGELTGKYGRK